VSWGASLNIKYGEIRDWVLPYLRHIKLSIADENYPLRPDNSALPRGYYLERNYVY
jgi:hypothetical protein